MTYTEKNITGINAVSSVNTQHASISLLKVTGQSTSSMELLTVFTDPLVRHCNTKSNGDSSLVRRVKGPKGHRVRV